MRANPFTNIKQKVGDSEDFIRGEDLIEITLLDSQDASIFVDSLSLEECPDYMYQKDYKKLSVFKNASMASIVQLCLQEIQKELDNNEFNEITFDRLEKLLWLAQDIDLVNARNCMAYYFEHEKPSSFLGTSGKMLQYHEQISFFLNNYQGLNTDAQTTLKQDYNDIWELSEKLDEVIVPLYFGFVSQCKKADEYILKEDDNIYHPNYQDEKAAKDLIIKYYNHFSENYDQVSHDISMFVLKIDEHPYLLKENGKYTPTLSVFEITKTHDNWDKAYIEIDKDAKVSHYSFFKDKKYLNDDVKRKNMAYTCHQEITKNRLSDFDLIDCTEKLLVLDTNQEYSDALEKTKHIYKDANDCGVFLGSLNKSLQESKQNKSIIQKKPTFMDTPLLPKLGIIVAAIALIAVLLIPTSVFETLLKNIKTIMYIIFLIGGFFCCGPYILFAFPLFVGFVNLGLGITNAIINPALLLKLIFLATLGALIYFAYKNISSELKYLKHKHKISTSNINSHLPIVEELLKIVSEENVSEEMKKYYTRLKNAFEKI